MSYIEDNLMPNEKIQFSAQVHPAVFLQCFTSLAISVVIFILGISSVTQGNQPAASPAVLSPISAIGILLLCLAGIFFYLAVVGGVRAFTIMVTTEFAVTNRRVVAKTGFIRRHTLEMLLTKVESIAVQQDLLGRMLNFGTVTVTGTGGTQESFRAIVEPIAVRKKINQIIEYYTQAHNP